MVFGKMKKKLYEKLLNYAKRNPDGFSIHIENGNIRLIHPTKKNRYVVSRTNNNTIKKIKQSFRNDKYTGYAGGWYDKKSDKYYIDKNIVTGDKEKAIKYAFKHNQLAIFDLRESKEIRVKKFKKTFKKLKLPVIKKEGKWYNKLTKKYVTEKYAKRINNFFKKNPESTLHEATGHGKYDRSISLSEHSIEVQKLAYGIGSQVIRTKDRKGKKVFYSPIYDKILEKSEIDMLKYLDYRICNKKAFVELYRLTRDKVNIYHIVTLNVNKRLPSALAVDFWMPEIYSEYNCITKELKKIYKKYKFSKMTSMYAHISCYFVSKFDTWKKGKTFGFVIPNNKGFRIMKENFDDILDFYKNKLEIDAYHDIIVEKISFYIYDYYSDASDRARRIASYRIGVNRAITY